MTEPADSESSTMIVRLAASDTAALDVWIDKQTNKLSRTEAIVLLLHQALSDFNPDTTTIRGEFE